METKRWLVVAMLMVIALTAGCATTPATADAAAATAQKFLQARVSGNAGALQGLLTERARKATPAGGIARLTANETFQFRSVGPVTTKADGWVQVPVLDVRITRRDQELRWPELRLTLHYEGKRWAVAWVEPLAAHARQAYDNTQFGDALELGRAMTEIDPYNYRGPLELHYANRGLNRLREAEVTLLRAGELATPSEQPDVEDAWARFKLALGRPEDAAVHARAALEKAGPYAPGLYSPRWQADVLVILGRAHLALGDRANAADAAKRAAALDPQNAALAMYRTQFGP